MRSAPKTDHKATPPFSQDVAITVESGENCIQFMDPMDAECTSGNVDEGNINLCVTRTSEFSSSIQHRIPSALFNVISHQIEYYSYGQLTSTNEIHTSEGQKLSIDTYD